jgi:hypothetical protein
MLQKLVAAALMLYASGAQASKWSAPVRGAFVDSCVSAAVDKGAPQKSAEGYCTCVNQALEKTYTEDEFTKGAMNPNDKYNGDIQTAARGCVSFLMPAASEKSAQAGAWSDMFKGTFVGSCTDAAVDKGADKGKAEKYCTCVSQTLEKQYSEDAFSRAAFKPTDKYTADIQGAAKGCVKHLQ